MSEGTVFDLEKLATRMNDYYPLINGHEKRCKNWFTGAGLGMFIHWITQASKVLKSLGH